MLTPRLFSLLLLSAAVACPAPPAEDLTVPTAQQPAAPARPVLGQRQAQAETPIHVDEATGLVIADGFELVKGQCTACHSAKLVIQNRGDKKHWLGLIRWMQETQGLWQFDQKTEHTIVDYLATHYGTEEGGRRPGLPAALMPPPAPRPRGDAMVQRAQAAIAPLKEGLKGTLMAAMKAHGPAGAVDSCHLDAPKVTAAASSVVKVGRASTRLRNPDNRGPAWVGPLLRSLAQSTNIPYLTAPLEGGGLGYAEPIKVGPLCLQCHGATLAPAVTAKLDEKYPEDRARGYALGEFRGVFWAEVPAG